MRLLFNMCCVLLIISCSTNVSTESIIIKDLHAQASNEGSTLRIDTLVVVSNKAISTFDVVQEELMFLRRFNSDLKETVRFNLKNIILTNPNERIMIPDFGVGITQALFERSSYDLLELIQNRMTKQISVYAPYVTILELVLDPVEDTSLRISLKYAYWWRWSE